MRACGRRTGSVHTALKSRPAFVGLFLHGKRATPHSTTHPAATPVTAGKSSAVSQHPSRAFWKAISQVVHLVASCLSSLGRAVCAYTGWQSCAKMKRAASTAFVGHISRPHPLARAVPPHPVGAPHGLAPHRRPPRPRLCLCLPPRARQRRQPTALRGHLRRTSLPRPPALLSVSLALCLSLRA